MSYFKGAFVESLRAMVQSQIKFVNYAARATGPDLVPNKCWGMGYGRQLGHFVNCRRVYEIYCGFLLCSFFVLPN